MYYSSGNYEAFARPKKPAGVDGKSAYIIGTGLAALSAACYLVRDAQMPGKNIHILEKDAVAGGACDGADIPGLGYVMRGGREMDNHFEVMWDLFRSIPVDRDRRRLRARRVLLAQQGRPQLIRCAAPPRTSARMRGSRQVRPVRQGFDGNHEAVLHPGRRPV